MNSTSLMKFIYDFDFSFIKDQLMEALLTKAFRFCPNGRVDFLVTAGESKILLKALDGSFLGEGGVLEKRIEEFRQRLITVKVTSHYETNQGNLLLLTLEGIKYVTQTQEQGLDSFFERAEKIFAEAGNEAARDILCNWREPKLKHHQKNMTPANLIMSALSPAFLFCPNGGIELVIGPNEAALLLKASESAEQNYADLFGETLKQTRESLKKVSVLEVYQTTQVELIWLSIEAMQYTDLTKGEERGLIEFIKRVKKAFADVGNETAVTVIGDWLSKYEEGLSDDYRLTDEDTKVFEKVMTKALEHNSYTPVMVAMTNKEAKILRRVLDQSSKEALGKIIDLLNARLDSEQPLLQLDIPQYFLVVLGATILEIVPGTKFSLCEQRGFNQEEEKFLSGFLQQIANTLNVLGNKWAYTIFTGRPLSEVL